MMRSCLALAREDSKILRQPSATTTLPASALGSRGYHGGVLEDQFISDDEVLSSARMRRLEDAATTFGHSNADCIGSRSRGYHGGVLEDQFTLEDGALPEAQRRSHSLVEAQKRSYLHLCKSKHVRALFSMPFFPTGFLGWSFW